MPKTIFHNLSIKAFAAVSLLSILFLGYLLIYSQMGEEHMAAEVENKISKKIQTIDAALKGVTEEPTLRFKIEDVDYVVYNEQGQVVYWTTNAYIPSYETIQSNKSDVSISNEHGDFIYKKINGNWNEKPNHTIIGLTQVRRTFKLSNQFLSEQYNKKLFPGNVEITRDSNSIPVKYQGNVLFYVKCTGASYFDAQTNSIITTLLVILMCALLLLIYRIAVWFCRRGSFKRGFISLIVQLVVLRIAMVFVNLPSSFGKMGIFEQSTFSFNWFYSTLGDGVMNVLFINIILGFVIFQKLKFDFISGKRAEAFISFVLYGCTYVAMYLFTDTIHILLRTSQLSLDIAESLEFSDERIAGFVLIVLLASLFFLIHYLAYTYTNSTKIKGKNLLTVHLIAFVVPAISLITYESVLLVVVCNALYISVVYYFKMPETLNSLKFESLIYLLITCIVLSVIGSFMIYKSYEKNERYRMQKYVSYLQVDRDIEGEYLLSGILDQIKNDLGVNQILADNTLGPNLTRRIKRVYLNNYFSDYEIDINLFDDEGRSILGRYNGKKVTELESNYDSSIYRTAYSNIYYDSRTSNNKRKKYICFIPMDEYDSLVGYVEIELSLKKFSSRRVLPQLLLDRNIVRKSSYSYVFIVDNQINYTAGDFEYVSEFDMSWLAMKDLYSEGIEINGFHHLGAQVGERTTVITQKVYPTKNLVSNFSFLFIILILVISTLSVLKVGAGNQEVLNLNFSTKIMLYSAASFVIPLLMVAIAIMTTTDSSNRKEIDNSNLKRTSLLAENLGNPLTSYFLNQMGKDELENVVAQLASYAGMDINVYSSVGRLLASSTPEIFEKGIISEYLFPEAYYAITQIQKESIIVEESVGSYQYKTSYVSVNSPDTGETLGVLASPYFASKNHLKRQQLQVFGNIINIFTFIFIISIGVAYWVIARLTKPIVDVANKLHSTGFVETNQPIEWSADDEIGILVKEYNNMLAKLEGTKVELARNEKEAAWREMAKQVAHEIKNPLTPMKLTIQHLSRIMTSKQENKKSLDILLSQIDTLDEIVTSFSHFAKMPTPANEIFDISQTLHKSIDLHVDKNIIAQVKTGGCLVHGDKKLFGRIFNNLILNAFEAMKSLDHPALQVNLITDTKDVTITFQDFGEGIDEDIYDKVFIPNFSTKDSGSGIGLAVAKRGIEHAGGAIWFDSEKGKGTTFYIRLSLQDVNEL